VPTRYLILIDLFIHPDKILSKAGYSPSTFLTLIKKEVLYGLEVDETRSLNGEMGFFISFIPDC
jgi:hypothetical protein